MGQRHQIYVRIKSNLYSRHDGNDASEVTIGIHHQWLYGTQPVRRLGALLDWLATSGAVHCPLREPISSDPTNVLNALYSVDHRAGYYHKCHNLEATECADPRLADNNDGITIIDLTGAAPAYCFMDLGKRKPLTAKQYIESYYKGDEAMVLHLPDLKQVIHEFTERNVTVLTLARVKEIFPAMFKRRAK